MPRYFFDVADGASVADEVGRELSDIRAARIEAARLAGMMLSESPEKFWEGQEWEVRVHEGDGLILFSLAFIATDSPALRRGGA